MADKENTFAGGNYAVLSHKIARCGKFLTPAEKAVLITINSYRKNEDNDKPDAKIWVYKETLSAGKLESNDGYDFGCGLEESYQRKIINKLKAKGVLNVLSDQYSACFRCIINYDAFPSKSGTESRLDKQKKQAPSPDNQAPSPDNQAPSPDKSGTGDPREINKRNLHQEIYTKKSTHSACVIENEVEVIKGVESDTSIQSINIESGEPTMKVTPTTFENQLANQLLIGLAKQGIKTDKPQSVSMAIAAWRKSKHAVKFTASTLNPVLNAVRNSEIKQPLDLFKPIKNSAEQIVPVWKTMIVGRESIRSLPQNTEALKVIEAWTAAGLNGVHNKEKVALSISYAVDDLKKQYSVEDGAYETLIETAMKYRTNGFRPESPACQTIEWLFKYDVLNGEKAYKIERLAAGEFNWLGKEKRQSSLQIDSTSAPQVTF